jgi:hypothetical protein
MNLPAAVLRALPILGLLAAITALPLPAQDTAGLRDPIRVETGLISGIATGTPGVRA